MNLVSRLYLKFRWAHVPAGILVALLQRTPVLRLLAPAEELASSAPAGAVVRSAFAAVASLGAVQALAGATQFVVSSQAVTGTVGTAITPVAFTVNGAQTPAGSYRVSTLPPGLTVPGINSSGILNASSGSISGTPTAAGVYSVSLLAYEFNNAQGDSYGPVNVSFNINGVATSAPAFSQQPTSQTVTVGNSVTFSAAATGTPTPTYQWSKNGANISGATNATYTISVAQLSDAGTYQVTATNSVASLASNTVSLTVNNATTSAPVFTQQPSGQTVTAPASVTFSAVATGTPAPTYQWTKNSNNIPGATGASYTIAATQTSDAGAYQVTATNSVATVTSNVAQLIVNGAVASAPVFTQQPAPQTANTGSSVTFTAAASGTPAPTYQWSKDGKAIAGATNASYTIAAVQSTDAGVYQVTATNSVTFVNSVAVSLTVNPSQPTIPKFVTQPSAITGAAGTTVVFSASVSGATSYQWQRNSSPVGGATSSTLVLHNISTTDAGAYTLVATNSIGSVTSTKVGLTVVNTDPVNLTHLINLSILTQLGNGQTLTMGAVVGPLNAPQSLPLVIRAVGPTLSAPPFNIPGTVVDPTLTVYGATQAVIASDDDWGTNAALANAFGQVGAFGLLTDSRDAALLASLPPGDFTVAAASKTGLGGQLLAEIYDASTNRTGTSPRLINVSTLMQLPSNNTLTAGFVLQGGGSTPTARTVLIRAVGPSLSTFNIAGMPDPALVLNNTASTTDPVTGQTVAQQVATNDNWGGDAAIQATMASVGAFALTGATSKDSVLLVTLPPGNYTATVQPADGRTGMVIIEVYEVP